MKKFYEEALFTGYFEDEDKACEFINENMGWANLKECFIAIFDPEVESEQMVEEIIEQVKYIGD